MAKKLVQLLIIADRKLKMTRNDTSLLVITRGVSGQLEDFGCEVLKNCSKIDGSTGTNTIRGEIRLNDQKKNYKVV